MSENLCHTIGVDLGGTKIDIAQVSVTGHVNQRVRLDTHVKEGAHAVEAQIIQVIQDLQQKNDVPIAGVGVGVAGQIESGTGMVHFAPNLNWHRIPLQDNLNRALGLPVIVVNDVRAATWGEWYYGAGQGCKDLICLFIGTGIGGGIISEGKVLSGYSNTCGELGHMIIHMNGPSCTCGNWGCLEALAGGWAIAKRAKEAVTADPTAGSYLLKLTDGHLESITAKHVSQAARDEDPMAQFLVEEVIQALIAGIVSLVNAFNPQRIILGGGVIEGMPEIISAIDEGVRKRALSAATAHLEIVLTTLHQDAGVVGAAAVAKHAFVKKGKG